MTFDTLTVYFSDICSDNNEANMALGTNDPKYVYKVLLSLRKDLTDSLKNMPVPNSIVTLWSTSIADYKYFLYCFFLSVFSIDLLKIFDKIDLDGEFTNVESVCLLASDSYSVIRGLPDSITIGPNINFSDWGRPQIGLPSVESIIINNRNVPVIERYRNDNLKKIVFKQQLDYLPYMFNKQSRVNSTTPLSIDFRGHTPKKINLSFYEEFKKTFINVDFDALDKLARSQESDYETRLDSFKKKYSI